MSHSKFTGARNDLSLRNQKFGIRFVFEYLLIDQEYGLDTFLIFHFNFLYLKLLMSYNNLLGPEILL